MKGRFQGVLDSITRVRGVLGAMVATTEDGLVVAESLMEGVRGNAVAALAANLFKRLGNATTAAGIGGPRFLHLQAADGTLLVLAPNVEVVVVAVTAPRVNVGLVRLEMLRAAEVLG